jgi:serine/threonine-protein kinase RsbW
MAVRTSTRFRRERAAVPAARRFAEHVLVSAGTPADVTERMVLAVAEACNNAILHAGGDDFTVSIVVDGGRALVSVADDGDGFDPPARPSMPGPQATGRRGLALMQALVDAVDVTSSGRGTTVALMQAFSALPARAVVAVDG